MKLYSLTRTGKTYRNVLAEPRPGEIVLVHGRAYASRKPKAYRSQTHMNGTIILEATWRIRNEHNAELEEYTVSAMAYTLEHLDWVERQFARKLGKELCEIRGIRWDPSAPA